MGVTLELPQPAAARRRGQHTRRNQAQAFAALLRREAPGSRAGRETPGGPPASLRREAPGAWGRVGTLADGGLTRRRSANRPRHRGRAMARW